MVYLPHWPIPNKTSISSDPDFVKLKTVLAKLGNPHKNLPPVIHIAGTNGKGSTAAFLAAIFAAANYRTHIYISPHLHHCNERIVLFGEQISDSYLYEILEEIRIISDNIAITLFEGLTLAAILAFSRHKADICIIEAGMGGRIDATNIIDDKILTIITSISPDHTEFLGNNLSAIAAEKSHIMRSKIPSIISHQTREAGAMIELRALEIGAPLIHYQQNFVIEMNQDQNFDFIYRGKNFNLDFINLPKPALAGQHQYLNAASAIAGIVAIKDFALADFNIGQKEIALALENVKWPSRLEKFENNLNKLLKNPKSEIWIDGAHNVGGAYVLAHWLAEKICDDEQENQKRFNYLIVGFSKGKAKKEFFEQFIGIVDFICAVRVEGEPNPEEAGIIVKKIAETEIATQDQDDLIEALSFLNNLNPNQACRIIICGSLYLARDVKKANLNAG